MKLKSALVVAAFASAFSVSAQAASVFSDNFNSYTPDQLNWAPQGGWTVTNGTVDLIGNPGSWNFFPSYGSFIDLDGSTNDSGRLSRRVSLTAGTTYILSFDLAGSQRDTQERVTVRFGSEQASYSLSSYDPFSPYTLSFTPDSTRLYRFSFQNRGPSDNIGALLDNVSVTAVPEAKSYAMIMAGLGLMGFIVRRRKNGQV